MAARENQGYLIAVISLVLTCLVLALVAFLGWMKANENYDSRTSLDRELKVEKRLTEAQRIRAEILTSYIGELGGSSVKEIDTLYNLLDTVINQAKDGDREAIDAIKKQIDKVRTEYDKDMALFLGNRDPQAADPTWRGLVKNFSSALSKKYSDYQVALNDQKRVEREAKDAIASKQQEVNQTKELLTRTQDDLAKKSQEFEDYKATSIQTLEEIQQVNKRLEQEKNQIRDTLNGELAKREQNITQLVATNTLLKDKVNTYEKEEFDLPDGKIVRVGQGRVFIDRGFRDGLKTSRTFSVYDAKDTNFERANPKASIEITKVWDHQAEARVTMENPLKPILADDYVINPVWDPGYSVPIALTGVFDLDGDGFDDRDRLIQMIRQNGGTVVAHHDADGNVIGEIDASTRYLVVGDSPALNPDLNPAMMKAMRKITEMGEKYEVQQIDTRKLLNWMGLHSQPIVERLDKEIGAQFRPSDASVRDR